MNPRTEAGNSRLLWALPLLGALALLGGCSSTEEDLCNAKCDCEGCSSAGFDACVRAYDYDYDDADYYGCPDYYDDLLACEDDTWRCVGHSAWETNCGPERDRLNHCIK